MKSARRLAQGMVALALGSSLLLGAAGCESKARRAASFYTMAQSGRAGAAGQMAAEWRAGKIKLDDCLDLAFQHLDNEGDAASLVFAGTVLDFAQLIEKDLPKGGEFEFMWMRIGGLACAAGEKAYNAGDIPTARSVVLAGPSRWQTESYWLLHPGHDAIAAYVLALTGDAPEAVRRLRSRPTLDPVQEQALSEIQAAMRQGK